MDSKPNVVLAGGPSVPPNSPFICFPVQEIDGERRIGYVPIPRGEHERIEQYRAMIPDDWDAEDSAVFIPDDQIVWCPKRM